jgi:phosphatidate cytidylyltransferase
VGLRDSDPANGFRTWAGTLFAGLYPSLLAFVAGLAIMNLEIQSSDDSSTVFDTGRTWIIILVASVWALDSFAYLTGRFLPRGRFMNHISPNKTWSGAIGGAIAAVVVATVLAALLVPDMPLIGLVLGVTIAVSAQAGDLAESMLKRAAGAKDSGSLVPGHGGVLDRIDSFLFAGPAAYVVVVIAATLDPNVV